MLAHLARSVAMGLAERNPMPVSPRFLQRRLAVVFHILLPTISKCLCMRRSGHNPESNPQIRKTKMNPELPYDLSLTILQDGSQKQALSPFLSKTIRERQLFDVRLEFVLPETDDPEQGLESSTKVTRLLGRQAVHSGLCALNRAVAIMPHKCKDLHVRCHAYICGRSAG